MQASDSTPKQAFWLHGTIRSRTCAHNSPPHNLGGKNFFHKFVRIDFRVSPVLGWAGWSCDSTSGRTGRSFRLCFFGLGYVCFIVVGEVLDCYKFVVVNILRRLPCRWSPDFHPRDADFRPQSDGFRGEGCSVVCVARPFYIKTAVFVPFFCFLGADLALFWRYQSTIWAFLAESFGHCLGVPIYLLILNHAQK